MKELIEQTIEIYNNYDGKLNYTDYNHIVAYLNEKGYVLVDANIYTDDFIQYVLSVADYYLKEGFIEE